MRQVAKILGLRMDLVEETVGEEEAGANESRSRPLRRGRKGDLEDFLLRF